MLSSRNNSFEKQSKFIQERIASVEKHFSELCTTFALYARKVARLRDAGDEVSNVLRQYSDGENVNSTLKVALNEISTTLCAIEEYRNARAHRLEVKIHAEAELQKASADMNRNAKDLQEQTDSFEKKKLQNIKSILKTFIEIEMSFQAKAIELYTVAYQQIDGIECESDLKDYRSQLEFLEDRDISSSKRLGFGSVASSLGQQERTKSKIPSPEESDSSSTETEESTNNSTSEQNESFYR